jgi:hypothetical protein
VSDLYIPTIDLPILLEEICRPILGLFPEKEYIKGIFVAVQVPNLAGWKAIQTESSV